MICRNCGEEAGDEALCDLGLQPLANAFLRVGYPARYPLRPVVCQGCGLVQLPFFEDPFTAEYPFRSGQSETWKTHLRGLISELGIKAGDRVVEVGGNDGTLRTILPRGVSYINIDPTARADGHTVAERLTSSTYLGFKADFVIALNVMAHVPDLDDFVAGLYRLTKSHGTLVVEVQDVEQMIAQGHWTNIYHEHLTYFSKSTLSDALERRGFYIDTVPREIDTHGGSLRVTAGPRREVPKPEHLRRKMPLPEWSGADISVEVMQFATWQLLHREVVGYGAPAKATTFLNYMANQGYVVSMDYVVDSTPEKQGCMIPGVLVPICHPSKLTWDIGQHKVDIVVILAWNYAAEILPKIPPGPEVWCLGKRLR